MVAIIRSILTLTTIHSASSWLIPTTSRATIKCQGRLHSTPREMGELQSQLPTMGLNELQTQFRLAIARQDLDAATLYRDELAERVASGAEGDKS